MREGGELRYEGGWMSEQGVSALGVRGERRGRRCDSGEG